MKLTDETIKKLGYEEILKRLRVVSLNLKQLGLDNREYQSLIVEIEKLYHEDFWSGWTDYQP